MLITQQLQIGSSLLLVGEGGSILLSLIPRLFLAVDVALIDLRRDVVVIGIIADGSNGHSSRGLVRDGLSLLERLPIFAELGHLTDELGACELDEGGDGPGSEAEQDCDEVSSEAERGRRKEVAKRRVADHEELDVKLEEEDDPEPLVLPEALEDVELRGAGS